MMQADGDPRCLDSTRFSLKASNDEREGQPAMQLILTPSERATAASSEIWDRDYGLRVVVSCQRTPPRCACRSL